MTIKGFTPRAIPVPPAESAALMARIAACARLIEERRLAKEREDAERAQRLDQARADAFRAMCAKPIPDNVTNLETRR